MKKATILLSALSVFLQASAQKLPNMQQISLRAPANVKIDGKTTEWGQFKARNSATDIFYTIANDDKRLYLAVYIEPGTVVNRAAVGGITLMVQTNGSKSQQGAAGIKFPYLEKFKFPGIRIKRVNEVNTAAESDSIMRANNKSIATNFKWIYTKGIAGVDSILAIYNDKGIEGAATVDEKRGYTCEIAIDRALLGLSAQQKFSYYIGINTGINKQQSVPANKMIRGLNADGTEMTATQIEARNQQSETHALAINASTDFWGEYTLAK